VEPTELHNYKTVSKSAH